MTVSATSGMAHEATGEEGRSRPWRWLVVAGVLVVAAAVLVTVLAVRGSGGSAAIVPLGVRQIEIRSAFPHARPAASYSITDPAKVRRITGLLNALDARSTTYDGSYGLGVAGIAHNQMCLGVPGPTASLELQGASGSVLASASFVTGDGIGGLSAACNPVWFGRGSSAVPASKSLRPQLALAGHSVQQAQFAQELEQVIRLPLCQRDVGTRAQYCKP